MDILSRNTTFKIWHMKGSTPSIGTKQNRKVIWFPILKIFHSYLRADPSGWEHHSIVRIPKKSQFLRQFPQSSYTTFLLPNFDFPFHCIMGSHSSPLARISAGNEAARTSLIGWKIFCLQNDSHTILWGWGSHSPQASTPHNFILFFF